MVINEKKESAQNLLKKETGDLRSLRPLEQKLVSIIAVCWALYQLALPSVVVINSTTRRAIHLAFAMALLFLINPCLKRQGKIFSISVGSHAYTGY